MSSMRNAVQRRNHKERAQPLERQKWGILEKHKDYTLRARDHNDKKRRLKALRQKASERNPDEFAFGMMSSTTKNGVRIAQRGAENGQTGSLAVDVVKLLKTQDQGYLQTVLQQTRRERERIAKEVILVDTGVGRKLAESGDGRHQVFDDEGAIVGAVAKAGDEDDDIGDDASDGDDMDDVDDGTDSDESEQKLSPDEKRAKRKRRRLQEQLHSRLDALVAREKDLGLALSKLEEQRAKMSNTVGGVNKNGVKFKIRERKR